MTELERLLLESVLEDDLEKEAEDPTIEFLEKYAEELEKEAVKARAILEAIKGAPGKAWATTKAHPWRVGGSTAALLALLGGGGYALKSRKKGKKKRK